MQSNDIQPTLPERCPNGADFCESAIHKLIDKTCLDMASAEVFLEACDERMGKERCVRPVGHGGPHRDRFTPGRPARPEPQLSVQNLDTQRLRVEESYPEQRMQNDTSAPCIVTDTPSRKMQQDNSTKNSPSRPFSDQTGVDPPAKPERAYCQRVYCIKCQSTYVVKIGYPLRAPHGPNKDCTAQDWRVLGAQRHEGELPVKEGTST